MSHESRNGWLWRNPAPGQRSLTEDGAEVRERRISILGYATCRRRTGRSAAYPRRSPEVDGGMAAPGPPGLGQTGESGGRQRRTAGGSGAPEDEIGGRERVRIAEAAQRDVGRGPGT